MDAPASTRELLRSHGLRPTPARETVLDILRTAPCALSHGEVEQAARARGLTADRVTLYRVLEGLVHHGLAHRIDGPERASRYGAAAGRGHAHFHCTHCGQVYCLESLQPAYALNLPAGFQLERAELALHGRCPRCQG